MRVSGRGKDWRSCEAISWGWLFRGERITPRAEVEREGGRECGGEREEVRGCNDVQGRKDGPELCFLAMGNLRVIIGWEVDLGR